MICLDFCGFLHFASLAFLLVISSDLNAFSENLVGRSAIDLTSMGSVRQKEKVLRERLTGTTSLPTSLKIAEKALEFRIPGQVTLHELRLSALEGQLTLDSAKAHVIGTLFARREQYMSERIHLAAQSGLDVHVIVGVAHLMPAASAFAETFLSAPELVRLTSHQLCIPTPRLVEMMPGTICLPQQCSLSDA